MSQIIETEVKIRVAGGAEDARRRVAERGYSIRHQRALQVDQVFDRPEGDLRRSRQLLRVRSENGRAILTFKGTPLAGPHKSREELEASTDDHGALLTILDRLGFVPSFRYEKYRTAFANPGEPGVIALDETPIGVFLELEGPGDWIDATAKRLGFTVNDYITTSYSTLYLQHRQAHGGPSDMIFSHPQ